MKYTKLKAFTIFEVLLSLVIIAAISMVMMPGLVSITTNQSLFAALTKTYSDLRQTVQAVPMLQMKGKIAPGDVDIDKFMQALALTHKCIDLKSDGTLISSANKKYSSYIYSSAPTAKTNVTYGGTSYYYDNATRVWQNTTIILKNNVIISKANDGNTIVVDVNGKKLPNAPGLDIYFFKIENEVFKSAQDSTVCDIGVGFNAAGASSGGCAARYIKEGKIK